MLGRLETFLGGRLGIGQSTLPRHAPAFLRLTLSLNSESPNDTWVCEVQPKDHCSGWLATSGRPRRYVTGSSRDPSAPAAQYVLTYTPHVHPLIIALSPCSIVCLKGVSQSSCLASTGTGSPCHLTWIQEGIMGLPQVLHNRVSSLHYGQVIAYLTLECLLYVSHNSRPFFRNDLPGKEDRGEV